LIDKNMATQGMRAGLTGKLLFAKAAKALSDPARFLEAQQKANNLARNKLSLDDVPTASE